MRHVKWFLRSAVAAAGLGSIASLVFAQDNPPPMMPPVQPLPAEEPLGGISGALPLAPPPSATNTLTRALPTVPAPAITASMKAGVMHAPAIAAANWIPDASGPKPAPADPVQWAVSEKPAEVKQVGGNPLPPLPPLGPLNPLDLNERPDYLPPAIPAKPTAKPSDSPMTRLPAPPALEPLPTIPLAPPMGDGPRNAISITPGTAEKPSTLPPSIGDGAKSADSIPTLPPSLAARSRHCPTKRVSDLCGCDSVWHLCPQDGFVRVRGWLDGGIVYNSSYPDSKFNGPYNSVDRSAEPMFNQGYAIIDHPIPTNGSFGAGFRADVLFGYDHFLGQSRGFEVDRDGNQRWNGQYYGLAIPQVYSEFGNDVMSLKVGHFYSPVGYETLPSIGNFFYSHAYSYQFGQPFTLWGALLTTQLTRHWQLTLGASNGWDTLVGRANNGNFTAGLKYTPDANWWWASFSLITGDNQNNPAGLPFIAGTDGNRTRYSFLFGLTPGGPCGRWQYVFHHYYGWQENGTPQGNFARWYGIDQYLYYRLSRHWRFGTRFEWFRDEDGTRVGLNRPANPNNPPLPGNYFSLTAGFNYTPCANFIVRPELRWDFTSDTARPAFNDGKKNNQLLIGCDAIWQF